MSYPEQVWVENPPCESLLTRVASGRGVAFAKRTHGVWDHLALYLSGGWWADQWRRCDQMIYKSQMPSDPEVYRERFAYLAYLRELLKDISDPPSDDRWIHTISLNLDYLTRKLSRPGFFLKTRTDPRLLSYWEWNYTYREIIDASNAATHRLQFAQTLTKGVVSNSILALPDIARSFHTVVLAPSKMHDLAQRWNLEPTHVTFLPAPTWPDRRPQGSLFTDPVLPALQTYRIRHKLLSTLLSVQSRRPLLYLFEFGTCAQWLIARLFRARPGAAYLDMGRTLELWFPDSEWPLKAPTATVYRRASRAYYGERRYLELKVGA